MRLSIPLTLSGSVDPRRGFEGDPSSGVFSLATSLRRNGSADRNFLPDVGFWHFHACVTDPFVTVFGSVPFEAGLLGSDLEAVILQIADQLEALAEGGLEGPDDVTCLVSLERRYRRSKYLTDGVPALPVPGQVKVHYYVCAHTEDPTSVVWWEDYCSTKWHAVISSRLRQVEIWECGSLVFLQTFQMDDLMSGPFPCRSEDRPNIAVNAARLAVMADRGLLHVRDHR